MLKIWGHSDDCVEIEGPHTRKGDLAVCKETEISCYQMDVIIEIGEPVQLRVTMSNDDEVWTVKTAALRGNEHGELPWNVDIDCHPRGGSTMVTIDCDDDIVIATLCVPHPQGSHLLTIRRVFRYSRRSYFDRVRDVLSHDSHAEEMIPDNELRSLKVHILESLEKLYRDTFDFEVIEVRDMDTGRVDIEDLVRTVGAALGVDVEGADNDAFRVACKAVLTFRHEEERR